MQKKNLCPVSFLIAFYFFFGMEFRDFTLSGCPCFLVLVDRPVLPVEVPDPLVECDQLREVRPEDPLEVGRGVLWQVQEDGDVAEDDNVHQAWLVTKDEGLVAQEVGHSTVVIPEKKLVPMNTFFPIT